MHEFWFLKLKAKGEMEANIIKFNKIFHCFKYDYTQSSRKFGKGLVMSCSCNNKSIL